jgi:hypothetical protein
LISTQDGIPAGRNHPNQQETLQIELSQVETFVPRRIRSLPTTRASFAPLIDRSSISIGITIGTTIGITNAIGTTSGITNRIIKPLHLLIKLATAKAFSHLKH